MPTTVTIPPDFQEEVKKLARQYPAVVFEVEKLLDQLENDERPGDKLPGVGYNVFKVRLRNPSAKKGKSGGFRAIYYVKMATHVVMLTIYSKSKQTDISPEAIRQRLRKVIPPDDEK